MPATFGQFARNRARVIIEGEGGSIFVDYRPGALTPRFRALFTLDKATIEGLSPEEQAAAMDNLTAYLAALVIDWDLLDLEQHPIPPTREGLRDVPYDMQYLILGAIHEDMRLGEANGARPSGASSTPTSRPVRTPPASPRARRTGTRSKASRGGSA